MSQAKPSFIKIPVAADEQQTMPVDPEKRLRDSEIRIEPCVEQDAEKIAEGLYSCFPQAFWDRKEPVALRPSDAVRLQRLAKRTLPSITDPKIKWIKAVLPSTNEIMGVACWTTPGVPVVAHFRRDAVDFFKWQDRMKWTDAELDEMWAGVSDEQWNGQQITYDDIRHELMGDEPHWFLSPVFTWPEYQGRGVGKKLMMWAIEQADSTDPPTPMYLESAPTARAVYMHLGFVPQGKVNMLRRGPVVAGGDDGHEAEKKKEEEMATVKPE